MEKIMIINSPLFSDKVDYNDDSYLPPLGLGIIASELRKNNLNISFIDCIIDNIGSDLLVEMIKKQKPEFCLINIFTTNYQQVQKVIEASTINIHWIIGGISTQFLYKHIFAWDTSNAIDVIYGDGEKITSDIIQGKCNEYFEGSGNKRYFNVKINSKYYIKNLDYEFLYRGYFNEPYLNYWKEKEVCIYTTRGCPNRCSFCLAANNINSSYATIRRKSVDKIQSELQDILSQHPDIKTIRVLDDLFLGNTKLCKDAVLIFRNLVKWRAMGHLNTIKKASNELIKELQLSGCNELFFGIESGSQRILDAINKKIMIADVVSVIERLLNVGIHVKAYFIVGLPGENLYDLENSYKLAVKMKDISKKYSTILRISVFQFRPYLGSKLSDMLLKQKKITETELLNNIHVSKIINRTIHSKHFNFDTGNFSNVDDYTLQQYFNKMERLND